MAKIHLEIITPTHRFYEGDVDLVIAPTLLGDVGVMAGHQWCCMLLDVDGLWIREEAGSEKFRVAAVARGFIDVKDTITVYTESAVWKEDIDMDHAREVKEDAEQWLAKDQEHDPEKIAEAELAIKRANARMRVASEARGPRG